ncbi:MAG: radical SAM protein [Desulfovibrio sp.]|nr:radical SAM protein [Desulfovibrio sp.]
MDLQGSVIRPPGEADSILLQVTLGCTHNACTFCGAYLGKPFRVKPWERIAADLDWAARHCQRIRRVFLCDGDALCLSHGKLLRLLEMIRRKLPWVVRVATYAAARNVARKSDAELRELREAGLALCYLGLESGDDDVLAAVHKGVDAATQIAQARRLMAAGMKLNVTVLLGLAGVDGSLRHARRTGEALTALQPDQVAALSLMLIPGTPLHAAAQEGRFRLHDARGLLAELRELLAHTHLERGLFLANHASNHLPMTLRLPRDKDAALALLDQALAGKVALKEERFRRL